VNGMNKREVRAPLASRGEGEGIERQRRAMLKKLARYVVVTPPAVTLLLAATNKPARAQVTSGGQVSSRRLKLREAAVDSSAVLGMAAALRKWPHMVTCAEEFRASFDIGDGVTIDGVDAAGVCLAAIKGLAARVETLESNVRGSAR
jgi:hypothetical protein